MSHLEEFSSLIHNFIATKSLNFKTPKNVLEFLFDYNSQAKNVFDKFLSANPRAGQDQNSDPVHALVPIPQEDSNSKRRPSKRCRVCYPKRKETRKCCIGCPEKPGLCSIEHFQQWHNKQSLMALTSSL